MRSVVLAACASLVDIGSPLPSSRAIAQAAEPPSAHQAGPSAGEAFAAANASRTLNGHMFLPSIGVPWAFASTWLGSRTGVGLYQVPVQIVPVLGFAVIGDAKLASFSQAFDVNVAVAPWLSLGVSLAAAHAIGVNASGAYNVGVHYLYGAEAALMFRLLERQHWHLGLRLDASPQRIAGVMPVQLTESVRFEKGIPAVDVSAITVIGALVRGRAALVLAESHTRYLGLRASAGLELIRLELERTRERNAYFNAGLGASLRFDALGAPLAVLLGGCARVRLDASDEDLFLSVSPSGQVTGQLETGLFYSAPKHVDAGVQYSLELGNQQRRNLVRLVINHFWR